MIRELAWFAAVAVTGAMSGCRTPPPPSTGEAKIDSSKLANPTIARATNPFCIHVKFHNNYALVYSENYAEAWATDGTCEAGGTKRAVQRIVVSWRYNGESLRSSECASAESCSFSERNYGIGKTIKCAGGGATDGNWSGSTSTDRVACP